jgi:serine/threonine protein kinase
MKTEPGSRLGPYEILNLLGAGEMGEVWRARDTRLDRDVAIKVLPPSLAQSAAFKLRFEREAKTISQLSHPNICTLYDVGENYLVMELLDGQNLADRISQGPLPLAEVFTWGIQIAEALDKAHRAGVVHRDLKPGNVMLTKSGAKLLDFGLAKSTTDVGFAMVDGATEHNGSAASARGSRAFFSWESGRAETGAREQCVGARDDHDHAGRHGDHRHGRLGLPFLGLARIARAQSTDRTPKSVVK